MTGAVLAGRVQFAFTIIFAITFGAGVITGIPMQFQSGTNWARFSHCAGPRQRVV